MRDSFDCKLRDFLHKMQSKESQDLEEYAMNNVTRDHIPFAHMLTCDPKRARVINIRHARSTCMHDSS